MDMGLIGQWESFVIEQWESFVTEQNGFSDTERKLAEHKRKLLLKTATPANAEMIVTLVALHEARADAYAAAALRAETSLEAFRRKVE
jgi:hypothetical protein